MTSETNGEGPVEPMDSNDAGSSQEPGGRPPWVKGVEEKADRGGDIEKRGDAAADGAEGNDNQ